MAADEDADLADATVRAEELAALKEIYDAELEVTRDEQADAGWSGSVSIGPARLALWLPRGYPSREAPAFELQGWPGGAATATVAASELAELFEPGEIVIFTWVEHLREIVNELVAAQEVEAQSAASAQADAQAAEEQAARAKAERTAQEADETPEIVSGEPFTSRKSTFQAHVAAVTSPAQVALVVRRLKADRKIAKATHNMMAYRIQRPGEGTDPLFICDNDDDGENAAGSRLAFLLQLVDARDVVVVVSRWYGGIQLGPARFKHICNVARDLLQAQGHVRVSTSTSGSALP